MKLCLDIGFSLKRFIGFTRIHNAMSREESFVLIEIEEKYATSREKTLKKKFRLNQQKFFKFHLLLKFKN